MVHVSSAVPLTEEFEVKGPRFAVIPHWVLCSDISDRALRLYAVLTKYANLPKGAFPSRQVLADQLHCGLRAVNYALDDLVKIGSVEVRPRTGSSNLYILRTDPPQLRTVVQPPLHAGATPPLHAGATPPLHAGATELNRSELNRLKDPAGELKSTPSLPDPQVVRAQKILKPVYETRDPKPATPFIAAQGLVIRLLAAGWSDDEVADALMQAPTYTTACLEMTLTKRRGSGPAPVRAGPTIIPTLREEEEMARRGISFDELVEEHRRQRWSA